MLKVKTIPYYNVFGMCRILGLPYGQKNLTKITVKCNSSLLPHSLKIIRPTRFFLLFLPLHFSIIFIYSLTIAKDNGTKEEEMCYLSFYRSAFSAKTRASDDLYH